MLKIFASWLIIAPTAFLALGHPSAPPAKVTLTIATLHAAALTTSRAAGDSTDAPFFVVAIAGPGVNRATVLPESGPQALRRDEALGARPLAELSLAAGDSVQVLVSVLENARTRGFDDAQVAGMNVLARAGSAPERVDQATRLVAPLVRDGAHWLGSVSLLVTNEGGAIYWRRLECVASCKVLSPPSTTALPATAAQPSGGVVELSGNGGTYHLALQANRAQ